MKQCGSKKAAQQADEADGRLRRPREQARDRGLSRMIDAALLLAALAAVAPLLGAAAIAGMPSLPMTVLHNAAAASLVAAFAYLTARKVME